MADEEYIARQIARQIARNMERASRRSSGKDYSLNQGVMVGGITEVGADQASKAKPMAPWSVGVRPYYSEKPANLMKLKVPAGLGAAVGAGVDALMNREKKSPTEDAPNGRYGKTRSTVDRPGVQSGTPELGAGSAGELPPGASGTGNPWGTPSLPPQPGLPPGSGRPPRDHIDGVWHDPYRFAPRQLSRGQRVVDTTATESSPSMGGSPIRGAIGPAPSTQSGQAGRPMGLDMNGFKQKRVKGIPYYRLSDQRTINAGNLPMVRDNIMPGTEAANEYTRRMRNPSSGREVSQMVTGAAMVTNNNQNNVVYGVQAPKSDVWKVTSRRQQKGRNN